jgi:hypothetical protein
MTHTVLQDLPYVEACWNKETAGDQMIDGFFILMLIIFNVIFLFLLIIVWHHHYHYHCHCHCPFFLFFPI